MSKIHVKMSTGDEFTISNGFYGSGGPLETQRDAEVEASFLYTQMVSVGTDQGATVNVAQIAYSWIE